MIREVVSDDSDDDGEKKHVDQLDNKEEIDSEDIVESW